MVAFERAHFADAMLEMGWGGVGWGVVAFEERARSGDALLEMGWGGVWWRSNNVRA